MCYSITDGTMLHQSTSPAVWAHGPEPRSGTYRVTDFLSSSSVVPRRRSARLSSMSTATRMRVFSVIRSPSPARWRFSRRRSLASSSSWSARSRSSLRSRPFHLAVCDSVTPAVRDSGTGRAARGAPARRVRAGAFGGAGAGAPSAAAGGTGRDGSTAGTTGASWPASLEQVGDALAGHQLTSFPAAIRPRSSSSSVCTRLTSSRTFAAYLPRYWITVCLFTSAVESAR